MEVLQSFPREVLVFIKKQLEKLDMWTMKLSFFDAARRGWQRRVKEAFTYAFCQLTWLSLFSEAPDMSHATRCMERAGG